MLCVIATIAAFALFVSSVMAAENVCKIGETEYATLEDAIAAVGSETTTITLIKDVELTSRFDIPTGKIVVLDMAKHTMKLHLVENNYASVIKGNLTIKGEGFVEVPGPYGFYVTGSLTVESGTFSQTEGTYLIFNTNTVTINGGMFEADYCAVNGYRGNSVVINGGEFYGNKPELIVGEIPFIVNGGTFNQDVSACKFENEAGEEVYCLTNDAEDKGVELVSITINVIAVEKEELSELTYFVKGYKFSDEEITEMESLGDTINEILKNKELDLIFRGVYSDKEGKNKVDFTKSLDEDTIWYLIIDEKVEGGEGVAGDKITEELPPKTGDINLTLLIGTLALAAIGTVIVSKKRIAKSN